MIIQYLAHSGILIETETEQLFIDAIDYVAENYDGDKDVYFFVTHGHTDHYDATICDYQTATFVLSDDIVVPHLLRKLVTVSPNNSYQIDDITVQTFASTDRGVAFLITLDGVTLLHSGDLNWWHWQNDDAATQRAEADQFKAIVDGITARIDVAFVPYDPRLGAAEHYSFGYYLDTKYIKYLVPIHMRDNFDVSQRMVAQFPHHRHKLVPVLAENEVILEI